MARRRSSEPTLPEGFEERIVDIDVEEEMQGAFLEYAYSVIYSRALPDARDGLKPVQRRILYGMHEMGLRPDRGHVKSSRIVGDVMGKYHPHGDGAIYDALVRMAQPFTMRLNLVDGHGNFGSLDDGPAASRYTEARMAPAALPMVASLDEDTVDFVPNYDDQLTQPAVMPAAYPNLLVNGAAGIAVGMATNMPPHNLSEVAAAACHLIEHPDATLADLMRYVPGPDLPGGGRIVGLEGIRDAYESGRGTFRTRATCRIESITPRRKGIVVTELPYLVGPEKVTTKIQELVRAKKLQGISDLQDLTDGKRGLHLVIEIKNGFHPEAVLEKLYKLTPLEDSFGINNVTLVDGQPRTLGLRELLSVYIDFRIEVVRRRSAHRLAKREERLHLVEGLLIAILSIDEVIALIRSSDDSATARARLIEVFDLSEAQANYILDLQLRRLTKFSRIELEAERSELEAQIAALRELLADEQALRTLVRTELTEVAEKLGTPRRTVLLESAGPAAATAGKAAAMPLEVSDDPCLVLLSSTGRLARTTDDAPLSTEGKRASHDAIVGAVATTARGDVGLVTTAGRVLRLPALDLPTLPPTHGAPNLSGGVALAGLVELGKGERALTLLSLAPDSPGLALGTAAGVVKRVTTDYPAGRQEWEAITLKAGDHVVGAAELTTGGEELVFITSDAHLLRFGADKVRPQGRAAGGVAGIKLAAGTRAVWFGAVDPAGAPLVVTIAGSGSTGSSVKVTPFEEYPAKGRATGGVRCHRFLRGEDTLVLGWVGPRPRAAATSGVARTLPAPDVRRDGSGTPLDAQIGAVAPGAHEVGAVSDGASVAPSGTASSAASGAPSGAAAVPSGPPDASAAQPGAARAPRAGLASDPGGLFDLPAPGATRPRPTIDRDDYDPDSLDDVVQTGEE